MKTFIKNRKGQKLAVLVDENENSKGLVFVMHGLGGTKEQSTTVTFADAFKEKGFSVVRFDVANTFGESEGSYEEATVTNYYEDLEDVIDWARKQKWYEEPFCLIGHSLGAFCISLYAEKYPQRVKLLAPISTVVSGELWKEKEDFEILEKWKKDGLINKGESKSKPGAIKILKWAYVEDMMKYDLLLDVDRLKMPVLLIVGELDTSTPKEQVKIFFNSLDTEKELHIIKDAPHTFTEKKQLREVKNIIQDWIKKNS